MRNAEDELKLTIPSLSHIRREREDPDDNKKEKNKNALSLEEFIEYFAKGMEENKDTIAAGMAVDIVGKPGCILVGTRIAWELPGDLGKY